MQAQQQFHDDRTPLCIPFILEHLKRHQIEVPHRPFIVGLNGIQGAGKTTLVSALAAALVAQGVPTLVCSIDDFYLRRPQQEALAHAHPDNALLQHRGEPGTHDMPLCIGIFTALLNGQPIKLPVYDKAAFSGQGDRLPEDQWRPVNEPDQAPVQAIIFEGWCVGFRPLEPADVEAKWIAENRTLFKHRLEHLLAVNDMLRLYNEITNLFDAFIHIDAEDTEYVYDWRQQQEDHLRLERNDPNAGMTPDQVARFVDAYYPAYELYTDGVRAGIFPGRPGCQLRLVVGRDRRVKQAIRI
jgi:D-glycerate 3-kinase